MLFNFFLLWSALVIAAFMLIQWVLSVPLRNVSLVDIGWGLGFVLVAWTCRWRMTCLGELLTTVVNTDWYYLLPMMVTVWGIRLALHLAVRNIGKPEDYRYAAMRAARGPSFVWSSLWIVFGLQGVVMWVVSLPIQVAAMQVSVPLNGLLLSGGCVVWSIGWLFETVGDWQLVRFKRNPANKGKVMRRGLWRFTRHPNYFGDCLVWWGHWMLCVALVGFDHAGWTVISPLLMTFLLVKVSGVALLEKSLRERSPEYVDYITRTNAFVPWFPKRP